VDDNETNRLILKEMLQSWRMKPELASSGPQAIELIKSAVNRNEGFGLFLLDLSMPEMDGFTLIQRIKKSRGPEKCPSSS